MSDAGDERLEAVLREQAAYYAARSGEYDRTAYGEDLAAAGAKVERVVDSLAVRGRVLELACGTGMWTRPLAERAEDLFGVDAAAGAIALARDRCAGLSSVRFECADLLRWQPTERDLAGGYDLVLMAAWLSHLPSARWAGFLHRVAGWLAPGGRLVVVDEHVRHETKEVWSSSPAGEVAVRTLEDGRTFRIVKVYVEPDVVTDLLERAGLVATVTEREGWLVCSATAPR